MSDDRAQRIPWLSQTRNGQVPLSPSTEVFILGVSILSVVSPSDTAAAAQGSSPARPHDVEAEAVPTDG